jgi:N-acyl-D-aspartate/D-glutamate deacylase
VRVPTNYAAFVGHIALRLAVLGLDAWTRASTPDEIVRISALLEDALAAGALGLSTNLMDHDGADRPVPSLRADEAELCALLRVLAKHPGATPQVIVDSIMRFTAVPALERLARRPRRRDLALDPRPRADATHAGERRPEARTAVTLARRSMRLR